MKIRKKVKVNFEVPTASQSDIAFLLIIFFIVTAIFFERTGIIFKLPAKSGKALSLSADEFIKIEAYNDHVLLNKQKILYTDFYNSLEQVYTLTKRNVAILYYNTDLEYGNFIRIFQGIKKNGNIKISIKPVR